MSTPALDEDGRARLRRIASDRSSTSNWWRVSLSPDDLLALLDAYEALRAEREEWKRLVRYAIHPRSYYAKPDNVLVVMHKGRQYSLGLVDPVLAALLAEATREGEER